MSRSRYTSVIRAGAVLGAAALLAACGSSSGGGSSTSAAPSSSSESSSSAAPAPYKAGVVLFSAADTSSMSMVTPFMDAAKAAGNSVESVDSNGDAGQAIAAIQNFVTKKVDAIFIPVFQPSQLAAGLAAAKAAGIVVVGMGGGTGSGMPVFWDNATLPGKLIAERIVADAAGKGSILAVTYSPGKPCQIRYGQLQDAFKGTSVKIEAGELQVPDIVGSTEKITSGWLAKNPKGSDPLMIWLCADSTVPGALAALRSANRTDVKVYSMGGEQVALTALQKGEIAADVNVEMAKAGEELAAQLPSIIEAGVDQPDKSVDVGAKLLDSTNIADFLASLPK